MSLHPLRSAAYLAGACAGGLATAAIVAVRERKPHATVRRSVAALAAAAVAVTLEELTPDR